MKLDPIALALLFPLAASLSALGVLLYRELRYAVLAWRVRKFVEQSAREWRELHRPWDLP